MIVKDNIIIEGYSFEGCLITINDGFRFTCAYLEKDFELFKDFARRARININFKDKNKVGFVSKIWSQIPPTYGTIMVEVIDCDRIEFEEKLFARRMKEHARQQR